MEQNEERNCRAQENFMQKTQPFEVVSEFALPDYRSEISRLLWVRPVFSAPMRYLGGGKADFSGAVRYEILYAGPDGKLYGVDLEDGYAFSTPMELPAGFENAEGIEAVATIFPDTVVSRVTAPRKLSVRCRMHSDVRGYGVKSLVPRFEGKAPDGEEKLCTAVDCGRYFGNGTEALELSGEVYPEGSEEIRVISARGEVFLPEATVADGAVHCRGEAGITLLCTAEGEDAVPFTLSLSLPLEGDVPLDGILSDCRARATGTVGNITTAVEPGKITVTAGVMLFAEAQGAEPVVVYRDLFVPGSRAECRFGEETLFRAGFCGNRNFSVNEECAKKDISMPEDAQILDAFATAEFRDRTSEGKNTALSGEICCHILYLTGAECGATEMRVPIRTVVEDGSEDMVVCACVPKCRVRAEHDRVLLGAEVALSARGASPERARVLSEVRLSEEEPTERGDLELYYPAAGESLFDVGKRYGIAPAKIAQVNGLSTEDPGGAESLAGARYLLIPSEMV